MNKTKIIKIVVSVLLFLIAWNIPSELIGLPDLSMIEQRVFAIFVLAAIMWSIETVPIWATSVLIIVVMLLTVSNNSLLILKPDALQDLEAALKAGTITKDDPALIAAQQAYGTPIKYVSIMSAFADKTVILFMGGFALAIACTKVGLDTALVRYLLRPFGTKSETVLLGFMLVTALVSMFMSNTATAAIMLALIAPVLRTLPADGKGRIGLALAIPFGANIGGIGTPIGTPPNAIAMGYFHDTLGIEIGFGQWMLVMVPMMLIILLFAWFVLIKMFPFKQKNIVIKVDGETRKDPQAITVYVTFAVTVLLWLADKSTGLNSYIVALIPLSVFCLTGIITKDDLKDFNWDVLWLVAGGFALGTGLSQSGFAEHFVTAIPFHEMPPVLLFAVSAFVCWGMSTFMSNSAAANLIIPILAAIGKGMADILVPYGGVTTMLVGVAIAASMAMALPISTPPNALAHSTGFVQQKDMAKAGVLVGIFGIVIAYVMLYFAAKFGLL